MESILIVSGTRPEIIKLAPLYHELKRQPWARVVWLHTGQHAQMAEQIMGSFDIRPDLTLVRQGDSLLDFSLGCRAQLEAVLTGERWSTVVVQGDTESAFQGALAAFYNGVPVAQFAGGRLNSGGAGAKAGPLAAISRGGLAGLRRANFA